MFVTDKVFFLDKSTTTNISVSPGLNILFLYFVVDNPDVISCDFESGFCGWSQSKSDNADFSRNTGLLRTPTADHTPGKGLFMNEKFIDHPPPQKKMKINHYFIL